MAEAVSIDLVRHISDTWRDRFNIKDSAGAAVDITGFTFKMTVNTAADGSGTELYQLTGSIFGAATDGVVDFAPSGLQAAQTAGTYFYDIEQTDAGGAIRTIVKGKLTYKAHITQNP